MLADTLPFVRTDDADAVHALAHGLVGEGAATEFLAWRESMDLPTPVELIADPSLIDYASDIQPEWLDGVQTVGLTSGASVPDDLVRGVLDLLREHGFGDVEVVTEAEERLTFSLPQELKRDMRAAGIK